MSEQPAQVVTLAGGWSKIIVTQELAGRSLDQPASCLSKEASMGELSSFLSLSEVVRSAADELREVKLAEPDDPVMAFEKCEIELSVATEVAPGGKIKFLIFEGGVDAKRANSHKVTLTFSAIKGRIISAIM